MKWKNLDMEAVETIKQPWDGQTVLIAIADEAIVGEAYFDHERREWNWANTHWTDPTGHSLIGVTHWMPLPVSPQVNAASRKPTRCTCATAKAQVWTCPSHGNVSK